jgi:transcriptional regulator with XRE-family HTH domain
MPSSKKLGLRVARLRADRKMSQRELAEAAGITEQALSRIENGVRAPRVDTVRRLSEALRVSVGAILDEGKTKPAPKGLRPDVEKITELLHDVSHDTVRLARRLVEVLVDERAKRER